MRYLNDSIHKLNPSVVRTSGSTDIKAFDKDGNEVSYDLSAAQAEFDKNKYKTERQYPAISEQLDQLYWDKKNGTNKWVEAVDKGKSDNPKS